MDDGKKEHFKIYHCFIKSRKEQVLDRLIALTQIIKNPDFSTPT